MKLSPIALFVYNRPEHTQKTIEALLKNGLASQSELFIFSDAPKNEKAKEGVEKVRAFIKSISGFKNITILEREENFGLAKSIIAGVTDIVNKYGRIIVLEDDLITSPYFLKYMNEALDMYEQEEKVISIHGYIYPVKYQLPETFFIKGADCWGWATWKRGWDLFESDGLKLLNELRTKNLTREFDLSGAYPYTQMLQGQIRGLNNSWAIRWHASAFLKNKYTLYPGRSLITNAGLDNSGTHTGNVNILRGVLSITPIKLKRIDIKINPDNLNIIKKFLKSPKLFIIINAIRLNNYIKLFKNNIKSKND